MGKDLVKSIGGSGRKDETETDRILRLYNQGTIYKDNSTGQTRVTGFEQMVNNTTEVTDPSKPNLGIRSGVGGTTNPITQEEAQYFKDQISIVKTDKEKVDLYNLYTKASQGKRDTDKTLISLNKAAAIKAAKKDMPGLRSQTLLKTSNKDGTDNFQKLKVPPAGGNNTGNTGGTLL